jgi:mRNA deadenylase 3'-5' endonuclease subunit Ccr4
MWELLSFFNWGDSEVDTPENLELVEQALDAKHAKHEQETFGPIAIDYFNALPFDLFNATPTDVIGYSHYIAVFKAHLDYVFAGGDVFRVNSLAPMAVEEVLQEEVALPSSVMPSDHVALVVDFEVKAVADDDVNINERQ